MLRSIQHPHIRPIVIGGTVTTVSTPSISIDVGAGDFSASARNSAGKGTLTRNIPVIRPGIVIGSVGASIANGGYFTYDTDPSAASVVGEALGAAGSGDDGTFDFLSLDYRNEFTDRASPLQTLNASTHGMRVIVARVAAAGTIALGSSHFSSISLASSVYTLTFANAFARTPLVFACPIAAAQKAYRVTSKSASACDISTFSAAEAAEDNAFYVVIVGWDRKDDTWGRERAVQIPTRKPRAEAFRVTDSGTAAIALGSTDATVVDNGTGDYTLTWTKAFLTEPIVIPVGKAGRAQLASNASTTAANIVTFNATGSAADDDFCALVIGADSLDTY